jgi:hypothetical protein
MNHLLKGFGRSDIFLPILDNGHSIIDGLRPVPQLALMQR